MLSSLKLVEVNPENVAGCVICGAECLELSLAFIPPVCPVHHVVLPGNGQIESLQRNFSSWKASLSARDKSHSLSVDEANFVVERLLIDPGNLTDPPHRDRVNQHIEDFRVFMWQMVVLRGLTIFDRERPFAAKAKVALRTSP